MSNTITSYGSGSASGTSSSSAVSSSNTLDKNAFLRILATELSNQDPTNSSGDSTQYIAQLAQFSSLEQMQNLNSTMTLSSAASLIGKVVEVSDTDSYGVNYAGKVTAVTKSGDAVKVALQITYNDGTSEIKNFNYSDITNVIPDSASSASDSSSSSSSK